MLTSILNLTSGQSQDSSEITASTFQSQFNHSVNSGQQQPASQNDFAQQLSQFRQLMQVPKSEMGKQLPDLNGVDLLANQESLLDKFTQLQQLINDFTQMLDQSQQQTVSLGELESDTDPKLGANFQLLVDSIAKNLNQLKSISADNPIGLNESQAIKLVDAIEALQSKFDKASHYMKTAEGEAVDPIKFKLAVTELLSDSNQALQRVNQAMNENKLSTSFTNAQSPSNKSEVANNLQNNLENSLSPTNLKNSDKTSPEKSEIGVANRSFKEQRFQLTVEGEAEQLSRLKMKANHDELGLKTNSRLNFAEFKLNSQGEISATPFEKANKVFNPMIPSSEALQVISKNISIGASPLDPKGLPAVASSSAESSTSIIHATSEMTSGQNVQSTQLTSQSNIQQGLNLRSDFSPNLALRIQWIFQQALSSAEIMMDPPELGPLSVKMQHRGGETNIIFQVNNQQTKEMIEENLPKLKELLQQQGIALGDTQVQQNQQQKEREESGNSLIANHDESPENDETIIQNEVSDSQRVAILDAYI